MERKGGEKMVDRTDAQKMEEGVKKARKTETVIRQMREGRCEINDRGLKNRSKSHPRWEGTRDTREI